MIKIGKDLSTIPGILKRNIDGLFFKEIFEEYKKMTPSLNQFSKQYVSNLISYGVKQDIFVATRTMHPFKKRSHPRKFKLKDTISIDEWNTLLELYKIDTKETRQNNIKITKEARKFKKNTILKQNYNNKNYSLVYDYLNKHNLDVLKQLPKGTSSSMESLFNLSENQIKHILIQLRKQFRKHDPEKYKVKKPKAVNLTSKAEPIKDYIIKQNFNLTKKFEVGVIDEIAKDLGVAVWKVKKVLKNYRKELNLKVKNKHARAISRRVSTIHFVDHCRENNMVRRSAKAELIACNTIIENLMYKLPHSGAGMIIGTPTAFCANETNNVNLFLTDNLKVAHVLDLTTNKNISPVVVIGNGVDPAKAALKELHWNNNNTTHHFKTIVDIVDRDSLCHYITILAEKHNLCKVVIMSSGSWTCDKRTKKKQGFDSNFKSPSEYLVKKYPNLHILAMTIGGNNGKIENSGKRGTYQWQIKYLHDGKTENV